MRQSFLTVCALFSFFKCLRAFEYQQPCSSEIYCHGPLLHTVQMAELYKDSKTFVDKKLRFSPSEVLTNFQLLMNQTGNQPSQNDVALFVESNFESEGLEFEPWDPSDWVSEPSFLTGIVSPDMQEWGRQLHETWKFLGRKIKVDVRDNPEYYSLVYLPNPFIVPGGRFREVYYWDSYWIVKGLLISEMNQTVKGMLENFLELVDLYGHIPNGGRIYYEQRSQPPLLIPMVHLYATTTRDVVFLRSNIERIENEYNFWMLNRTIAVKGYDVAQYNVGVGSPRPESYKEDHLVANDLNQDDKKILYSNLHSGAESGWDFSTRWFITSEGSNDGSLGDIAIKKIIPVDLNAYLCMNSRLLSELYSIIGDDIKATYYQEKFSLWKEAMQNIFWNETEGVWMDFDTSSSMHRNYFYGSNVSPLWAQCWDSADNPLLVQKVIDYLDRVKATSFIGGVPTSLQGSGQQWDFPNGWAPLQHLLVVGLEGTGDVRAREFAFDLAKRWLDNNYVAYQQSTPNAMFEKYDVTLIGLPGGGGEYDVQLGFGWSNGVVLDFLQMYGDRL